MKVWDFSCCDHYCSKITGAGKVKILQECRQLRELELSRSGILGAALRRLCKIFLRRADYDRKIVLHKQATRARIQLLPFAALP